MTGWRLAPGVQRRDASTLIGGSPYRLVRLTAKGADALTELLTTQGRPSASSACGRLATRLVRAGMLVPPLAEPVAPADVTIVIPALSTPDPVRRLLDAVPGVPVVVVDDGSPDPLTPLAAGRPNVVVVRHDQPRGPAAARNSGVAVARTRWVAFVDADVEPPMEWLGALLAVAGEADVVAAAPRIINNRTPGLAGLLESRASALDLGPVPADVGPGMAVSYVPTATLLVDREHFLALGGFDESMKVGEDVDLVWRLSRRGRVRYEPRILVAHRPRTSLRRVLSRRSFYGESIGLLELRHPGVIRHADVSVWSLAPWLLGLAIHPLVGIVAAAAAVAAAPGDLPTMTPRDARRLAARGQVTAAAGLGRWFVRPLLPATAIAVALSRQPLRRRLLLAAAVGYADVAVRTAAYERRAGTPYPETVRAAAATVLARVLDDAAYSAGVWRSCVNARTPGSLLPRVRNLPRVRRRR